MASGGGQAAQASDRHTSARPHTGDGGLTGFVGFWGAVPGGSRGCSFGRFLGPGITCFGAAMAVSATEDNDRMATSNRMWKVHVEGSALGRFHEEPGGEWRGILGLSWGYPWVLHKETIPKLTQHRPQSGSQIDLNA